MKKITKQDIENEIKEIMDPELGIDIWTLGLIYDINIIDKNSVHVLMTFTSPFCPEGGMLISKVETVVKNLGFEKVNVEVTFDPPWEPSEQLREILGI